jgi:hypothetical protein
VPGHPAGRAAGLVDAGDRTMTRRYAVALVGEALTLVGLWLLARIFGG